MKIIHIAADDVGETVESNCVKINLLILAMFKVLFLIIKISSKKVKNF